jgi:hypothetical protein
MYAELWRNKRCGDLVVRQLEGTLPQLATVVRVCKGKHYGEMLVKYHDASYFATLKRPNARSVRVKASEWRVIVWVSQLTKEQALAYAEAYAAQILYAAQPEAKQIEAMCKAHRKFLGTMQGKPFTGWLVTP